MRLLLSIAFLLSTTSSAYCAVTLAVNQQSGAIVQERASQLARQLGTELGETVNVVALPDAGQVEVWLNRYATAELALVEADFLSGRAGQFVVIGPVGPELTLLGRQGINGDLPQRIGAVLAGSGSRTSSTVGKTLSAPAKVAESPQQSTAVSMRFGRSKSASEDRYFVSYVYREKLHREPSADRLEYWTRQLQDGAVTKRQLFDMACDPEIKGCDFE